jgi:NAD(P)-dependent dehydrogenase (short-subunit alcohol dehydrogenase family)
MSEQRVLITAGADGIGKRTAEVFLAHGARVHVCDIDEARLHAFAAQHDHLSTSLTDVADPAAIDALFEEAVHHLGGLDVLVNNAGIAGPTANLEDIEPEVWHRCVDINLTAQYLCSRRAIPLLKQNQTGCIINLSSSIVYMGATMRSPYVAAKWAVIGLTKALAAELGPFNIRVNAIAPGAVEGARMERVLAASAEQTGVSVEELRRQDEQAVAMGTFVEAEDIAQMAYFLCSDKARYVSGQLIGVDGFTL